MSSQVGGVLQFLLYVGQAKRTYRTGWVLRGVEKVESVADHMYRMSLMALLLPSLDEQSKVRCLKLALVHDLAESVVGDLTHFDNVSKDEKHRRENEAMLYLTSLLPAEIGTDLFELFKEYSEQQTNEARLVKDLDIFDMLLQAHEYEQLQKDEGFLEDFFAGSAEKVKTDLVRPWLEQLMACRASGEHFKLPSDSNLKTILKDILYDEHGAFLSNLPSAVLREKSDRIKTHLDVELDDSAVMSSVNTNDDSQHSNNNPSLFSFQAFVDDIPFQFNQKYRTIHVSNLDVDEYETKTIREILSRKIDFTLENRVLVEALEDLKRKKKEIETDTSHQVPPTKCPAASLVPPHGSSPVPSFRLPSVRDIYWPTGNLPVPIPVSLPPPMHLSHPVVPPTPVSSSSSINTSDLTETFDGRLTSDDPFNDAELRSLNDVVELNHLYSALGSANTIRR